MAVLQTTSPYATSSGFSMSVSGFAGNLCRIRIMAFVAFSKGFLDEQLKKEPVDAWKLRSCHDS
jgi:hypothetical protein